MSVSSPALPDPVLLSAPAAHTSTPARDWRLFAPALAGSGLVKVRDASGRYSGRPRRLQPDSPPTAPTAVLLYDKRARARCLALDLDSRIHGAQQVVADSERALELANAAGLPAFVDASPSGGRHVYLPLQEPISADLALQVGRALQVLLPTLDVAPLANRSTGAVRPPGSPHPLGGHQTLVSSLADAAGAIHLPGTPAAWARFVAQLPQHPRPTAPAGQPASATAPRAARAAAPVYAEIARTGTFDRSRYATPSEARFAVACHLLRRGWTAQAVLTAAADGTFPGLRALLRRHRQPLAALSRDLDRAVLKLSTHLDRPIVRRSHTREQPSPPGASTPPPSAGAGSNQEYAFLRSWWTAARHDARLRTTRAGLVDRSVLQALGALAQMKGSRYVDAGVRSLGEAACLEHSVVARSLKRLAAEADPFLVLLQRSADTNGAQGDLYELVVPSIHLAKALSDPWQAGVIERIHPVFWQLPKPTRYLWQALTDRPRTRAELARDSGLSRQTLHDALGALIAVGLVRQDGRDYRRGPRSLDQVALALGGEDTARRQHDRHLVERRAWRALKRLPPPAPDRALRAEPVKALAAEGLAWWSDGTPIPHEPDHVDDYEPKVASDSEVSDALAVALVQDLLGARQVFR